MVAACRSALMVGAWRDSPAVLACQSIAAAGQSDDPAVELDLVLRIDAGLVLVRFLVGDREERVHIRHGDAVDRIVDVDRIAEAGREHRGRVLLLVVEADQELVQQRAGGEIGLQLVVGAERVGLGANVERGSHASSTCPGRPARCASRSDTC